jgi:hypothetical protein
MSSMAMTAVIIAAMIVAGGSSAFVFFIAFLGFFFFSIRAVLQAWLLDATPANMGGSSIGMLFAIQSFGSGLGPIICGMIADRYGLLTTFYFLVGTIIVANMLIFFTPIADTRAVKARFAGQPADSRRVSSHPVRSDAADGLEPRPRVDFGLRQHRRLRPEAFDDAAHEWTDRGRGDQHRRLAVARGVLETVAHDGDELGQPRRLHRQHAVVALADDIPQLLQRPCAMIGR